VEGEVDRVEEEGEESEEEEEEVEVVVVGKRVAVKGSEATGSSSALKRYWNSSELDISSTFASGMPSKFISAGSLLMRYSEGSQYWEGGASGGKGENEMRRRDVGVEGRLCVLGGEKKSVYDAVG